MKTLLTALALLTATTFTAPPANTIDYRFDDVRRSVTLATPTHEVPAVKGLKAQSGDKVHTGWFSYALIASEQHRAKFEIFSSTDVELAGGAPGVLLSLNRGKLHAIFDKITGNEPRVVKTPGALLAVRGTEYTVSVDGSGHTQLNVYKGIVEVTSPLRTEPLFVRAGEQATYGPQERPMSRPMPPGESGEHRESPQGEPHGDHDRGMQPPPSHGGHH